MNSKSQFGAPSGMDKFAQSLKGALLPEAHAQVQGEVPTAANPQPWTGIPGTTKYTFTTPGGITYKMNPVAHFQKTNAAGQQLYPPVDSDTGTGGENAASTTELEPSPAEPGSMPPGPGVNYPQEQQHLKEIINDFFSRPESKGFNHYIMAKGVNTTPVGGGINPMTNYQ